MRVYDPTSLNTPTDVELHAADAFAKARGIMTNGYYPEVVIEGGPIGQLPASMRTINNNMSPRDITVKALTVVAAQRSADKSHSSVAIVMNQVSQADITNMTARMESGQTRLLMVEMDAAVVKAASQAMSARVLAHR